MDTTLVPMGRGDKCTRLKRTYAMYELILLLGFRSERNVQCVARCPLLCLSIVTSFVPQEYATPLVHYPLPSFIMYLAFSHSRFPSPSACTMSVPDSSSFFRLCTLQNKYINMSACYATLLCVSGCVYCKLQMSTALSRVPLCPTELRGRWPTSPFSH